VFLWRGFISVRICLMLTGACNRMVMTLGLGLTHVFRTAVFHKPAGAIFVRCADGIFRHCRHGCGPFLTHTAVCYAAPHGRVLCPTWPVRLGAIELAIRWLVRLGAIELAIRWYAHLVSLPPTRMTHPCIMLYLQPHQKTAKNPNSAHSHLRLHRCFFI